MSEHSASVQWQRSGGFDRAYYSRAHTMHFPGGIELAGNASPANIPATVPPAPGADPEQTLIAALASCHMLWFLDFACRAKFIVDSYRDDATGMLGKNAAGKMAVTHIVLRPLVVFSGTPPSRAQLDALHNKAHEHCFIANSVTTQITIEPQ
jgi:organic hydroperoxide reductase OsmC/OhrA